MAKVTKASVNYRSGKGSQRCNNCSMYRPPQAQGETGSCTLVAGSIKPSDLCDRWKAKK